MLKKAKKQLNFEILQHCFQKFKFNKCLKKEKMLIYEIIFMFFF